MAITTSTGYWRLATKSFSARIEGASYIGVPFSAIERNSPAAAENANASRTETARVRISGLSRCAAREAARRLLGLHERLRPARDFEGQIFHVDFLDSERRLLRFAHQGSDKNWKGARS